MPKKTKREKILAEARRIILESKSGISVPREISNVHAPDRTIPKTGGYHFAPVVRSTSSRPQAATFVSDDIEFTAIRNNLVKTILIAVGALAVEFILYWKFGSY